ncbi:MULTISPECIES: TPM domain-containing protein [Actinomycetaceae]|uniref:TPM domain-containing protein n=1 Tax=Actinomycetaceae TaxID=2049 RepID=UPI00254F22BE|nr:MULTISPECIES: TPM domain-containing protein [unclassified Pauljensenia]MDK6400933.1 TPM domain-containing protein [Pauljensenia sp. UMB9872]MDK7173496.1 TPM domain-containing protein [Pauljensenia sp. UMB1235]
MSFRSAVSRACASAVAGIALIAGLGAPALATSPVTISTSVTDPSDWLSDSQVSEISSSADEAGSAGLQVYFVTVPDFSGAEPIEWCKTSGVNSGLSNQSIVYVIAYEERMFTTCGNADQQVVTDSDITRATSVAKKVLAKSNPLDADTTTDAATTFISTLTSTVTGQASSSSSHSSSTGAPSSGKSGFGWIRTVVVVVVIGGLIVFFVKRNKAKGASTPAPKATADHPWAPGDQLPSLTEDQVLALTNQSSALLLQADELVRSAADELDFARAQFGETKTDAYAKALSVAQAGIAKAFASQQTMNEASDSRSRTEAALTLQHELNQVMPALVEQQKAFSQLRDEEASVPTQATDVKTRILEAIAALPSVEAELTALQTLYSSTTVASLMDNPQQARALLDSASVAANQATSLATSDPSAALVQLDIARRALAMAGHQTEAIMSAKQDLAAANEVLTKAIASITSDLSDVTTLKADSAAFAPLVAEAQKAVAKAQSARAGSGDPLAALENLRLAESQLDAALEPLRSQADARERKVQAARNAVSDAQAQYARANSYIQGRRGVIPLDVRSTLAEAKAELDQAVALVQTDPDQAMTLAKSARSVALTVLSTPINDPSYRQADQFRHHTNGSGGIFTDNTGLGNALLWSVLLNAGRSLGQGGSGGGFSGGGFSGGGFGGSGGGFGGGSSGSF